MSTPTQTKSAATLPQRARWSQHIPVRKARSGEIVTLWLGARLGRLITLATLSITVPLITGCRPGEQGNASPTQTYADGDFRWTITRLEGARPETQIGWLDNETVLFIGTNHSTNGSPEIRGLYAWDRKSPAKLVLADASRFCFDGKTWTMRTGEVQRGRDNLIYRRYRLNPSNLRASWIGPDVAGPSNNFLHPYTCKEQKQPPALEGHFWDALRPQDGYLDFGTTGSSNQEVTLIRPNLKDRIPLGFRTRNPITETAQFSSFKSAYVTYNLRFSEAVLSAWRQNKYLGINLIQPNGLVHQMKVGSGPWSSPLAGDRSLHPSLPGTIISSKAGSRLPNTSAGIYLARNKGSYIKLDSGITDNTSVSNSGCKIAYSISEKEQGEKLISIDLCPP